MDGTKRGRRGEKMLRGCVQAGGSPGYLCLARLRSAALSCIRFGIAVLRGQRRIVASADGCCPPPDAHDCLDGWKGKQPAAKVSRRVAHRACWSRHGADPRWKLRASGPIRTAHGHDCGPGDAPRDRVLCGFGRAGRFGGFRRIATREKLVLILAGLFCLIERLIGRKEQTLSISPIVRKHRGPDRTLDTGLA